MTSFLLRRMFAAFVLAAVFINASVFAQNVSGESFSDVSSEHPNKDAVSYLKSEKVIQGYGDGEYRPDNTINRAEFMKIVIAATVKAPSGSECFKDVHDEWFAKYICEAKKQGLVAGYPDGTFKPGLNINVVEASKIIANGMIKAKGEGGKGHGSAGAELWYKPFIGAMEAEKAIPVSIDYPEKKITRGEMAEMTWRVKADIENKPTKTFDSLVAPLPTVSSCLELEEKFALQSYRDRRGIGIRRNLGDMVEDSMDEDSSETAEGAAPAAPASEAAPDSSAAGSEKATGAPADDFSSTNVQVEGVDEADIVKNDANYVYLIKERSIRIVKAVPVNEMKEVGRVTVDAESFYPAEMYVTSNRLVVVGSNYDGGSKTEVHVFDITDRANVKKFRNFSFEGNYVSSRRIGNYAYFVMNSYPQYQIMGEKSDGMTLVPEFTDSADGKTMPVVPCSSIRIFPRYDQPNIMVVAGIPLNDGETASVRQAFLGSGNTVYASLENLYVSTTKRQYDDMKIYDIWMPPVTNVSTMFYRFALKDGKVEYKTNGEVEGSLLNQFSMDESGEAFRVTTTKGEFFNTWDGENKPNNQLYILDKENLGTVLGKVADIGKGEKIKSVRFMGRRAYVVTFKNTDPFFVIDVGNPRSPKILGELKLPGYSDYLHPYDENHIIGFGKDAVDASAFKGNDDDFGLSDQNFAWYQGMKLAMFDVSDPTAPKEMFHEVIGDRGTNSELLYNHKALLFSKGKNLIAFPIEIAEIKNKDSATPHPTTYGEVNFRGAVVYSVDMSKGFVLKGKITHVEASDFTNPGGASSDGGGAAKMIAPGGSYFNGYDALIKRLLYIGNNLYAISMKKVSAHSLSDLSDQGSAMLKEDIGEAE